MNNRDYKKFAPGEYFHVYNRGNGKQKVFLDEQDYKFFLYRLRENLFPEYLEKNIQNLPSRYHRQSLPKNAFTLVAYCLMPNHFHFLIRQNGDTPVSELLKKLLTSFAKFFNKKHGKVGSLFEHKFRAVLVADESYLLWLSAYIHQNPHTAGLVDNLDDWPYSSYPDYIGQRSGILCSKGLILSRFSNETDYKDFVERSFEKIKQRKEVEKLLIDEDDK